MVSNASEDLPEPLTPVTTVMALWGTSRLIFFRLWTRAPRIEITSWLVFTAMSSLVATGKPGQRVRRALPKLQIIRCAREQGKPTILWLFDQADLSHAAFNFKVNRGGSFTVGFVGVFVVFMAQPMRVDRANASRCLDYDANFSGQTDRHLADTALQIRDQVILAVASEVQIRLAGPHGHIQARDRHIAKPQVASARAHFHSQFKRHFVAEAQIPLIVFGTEVHASIILRNTQMADAACDVVLDAGSFVRRAVIEIRIKEMAGAAADIEFTRASFERHIDRLGVLPAHRPRIVLHIAGIAAVPCERPAVPEENDQHQHEGQRADRRSERYASRPR